MPTIDNLEIIFIRLRWNPVYELTKFSKSSWVKKSALDVEIRKNERKQLTKRLRHQILFIWCHYNEKPYK